MVTDPAPDVKRESLRFVVVDEAGGRKITFLIVIVPALVLLMNPTSEAATKVRSWMVNEVSEDSESDGSTTLMSWAYGITVCQFLISSTTVSSAETITTEYTQLNPFLPPPIPRCSQSFISLKL